jgi:hypothetical protein
MSVIFQRKDPPFPGDLDIHLKPQSLWLGAIIICQYLPVIGQRYKYVLIGKYCHAPWDSKIQSLSRDPVYTGICLVFKAILLFKADPAVGFVVKP